ncbi:uncharacterized protein LOC141592388 isoform X1 [Silene latifolia]|uniref:uncharacterized protein LOC141592388 isoform X1 n=1 Tax=Silene latifolia TaxID=37657 RepID=UPI003D778F20
MGADPINNTNIHHVHGIPNNNSPLILGLQPSALVDHVAKVDWSLLYQLPGERGGSIPVAWEDVKHILSEVGTHISTSKEDLSPIKTLGGGSVANTIRGLSACFGISSGLVGACGDDPQGKLFIDNMNSKGVDLSRMRTKKGDTAQCVCLVDHVGNRTMRPCLAQAVRLKAEELVEDNFRGSKWLVMRFAAINLELIHAAVRIAKRDGLLVSLDLASFEMIRSNKSALVELLESGDIDLCFANEDEAMEVVRGRHDTSPEDALDYLATHCQWAVVTLGPKGCIAKHGKEVCWVYPHGMTVKLPAIGEAQPCDATGAGDLFASGFIYGLIEGLSLEDCCKVGTCSGGSVIRSLGGDVTPENLQWMYKQLQNKDLSVPQF